MSSLGFKFEAGDRYLFHSGSSDAGGARPREVVALERHPDKQ